MTLPLPRKALTGLAGAPLGGAMADYFGRRPAVILGSAVTAAAFLALPLLDSKGALMVAVGVVGFGESFLMSASTAMSTDVTKVEQRGAQNALNNQVGDITFVVMPLALTFVATQFSYDAAFVITSSVMVLSNIGFAVLAKPPPPRNRYWK